MSIIKKISIFALFQMLLKQIPTPKKSQKAFFRCLFSGRHVSPRELRLFQDRISEKNAPLRFFKKVANGIVL